MREEELMVGNWVSFMDETFRIFSVLGYICVLRNKTMWANNVVVPDIKPIPITSKILNRIGFIDDGKKFIYQSGTDEVNIEKVLYKTDGCPYCLSILRSNMDSSDCLCLGISYVHELQNALRLFKVNLEINLYEEDEKEC